MMKLAYHQHFCINYSNVKISPLIFIFAYNISCREQQKVRQKRAEQGSHDTDSTTTAQRPHGILVHTNTGNHGNHGNHGNGNYGNYDYGKNRNGNDNNGSKRGSNSSESTQCSNTSSNGSRKWSYPTDSSKRRSSDVGKRRGSGRRRSSVAYVLNNVHVILECSEDIGLDAGVGRVE